VDTDSGGHAAEASEAVRPAEVVRARNTQTAHPVVKEAKVDKRNLWLAREGEVPLNSAAAIGVSTADMEKRQAAAIEKGEKLRNPNYHVSTVRLLFRNLPATLTEKQLQRLCLDALQEKTTNNLRVRALHCMHRTQLCGGSRQSQIAPCASLYVTAICKCMRCKMCVYLPFSIQYRPHSMLNVSNRMCVSYICLSAGWSSC
jgi:hypothetical protein